MASHEGYAILRSQFKIYSTLRPNKKRSGTADQDDGIRTLAKSIYLKLINIELLIMEHPDFLFSFQYNINGVQTSVPFSNTIRKLCIPTFNKLDQIIFAREVLWLLIFCSNLHEAGLGFSISIKEVLNYISEYHEAFKGYQTSRSYHSSLNSVSILRIERLGGV